MCSGSVDAIISDRTQILFHPKLDISKARCLNTPCVCQRWKRVAQNKSRRSWLRSRTRGASLPCVYFDPHRFCMPYNLNPVLLTRTSRARPLNGAHRNLQRSCGRCNAVFLVSSLSTLALVIFGVVIAQVNEPPLPYFRPSNFGRADTVDLLITN